MGERVTTGRRRLDERARARHRAPEPGSHRAPDPGSHRAPEPGSHRSASTKPEFAAVRGRRRQESVKVKAGRRRFVLAGADVMITLAFCSLLYVGWQVGWEDQQAQARQAHTAARLEATWNQPVKVAAQRRVAPPKVGEAIGIVHIPRFGHGWSARPLVEGVSSEQLAEGTGHYPGTAMPGAVGNVGIAGHRVSHGSPFRQIADLEKGDAIVIETPSQWYVYRVTDSEIVAPTQVDVIAPVPGKPGQAPSRRMLTLTSCHPLYSARERYVVHAELASTRSRADGPPPQVSGV